MVASLQHRLHRSPAPALAVAPALLVIALGGLMGSAGPATAAMAPPGAVPGVGGAVAASRPTALPPLSRLRVTFTTAATGLRQPVQAVSARDGSGRLFVVERAGTVRVWRAGSGVASRPYLDIARLVNSRGGEQGLLGLAFDPSFRSNGRLYVTYTRADGALVLARLTTPSPTRATAVDARTLRSLLVVPHPGATNHNGGSLAFGRDGYLLVGTGDGGGAGDPRGNARNTRVLLGKVLRLDVRRACRPLAYCIPTSNPFRTGGGRPEIYLWGLRNPWRMSVDRGTGDLLIGDVGQDRWEELDRVPFGRGGRDLQWSCKEGRETFRADRCGGTVAARVLAPFAVLCHPDGVAGCPAGQAAESITGGYVYRGSAFRTVLAGRYLAADFVTGLVFASDGGAAVRVGALRGVTGWGEDERGELFAVTYDGVLHGVRAAAA